VFYRSWFFHLCAGEGFIALAGLLSIPSEGGVFSPARLVLTTIFLTLILGWIYSGLHPARFLDVISQPRSFIITALLALTFGLLLFLLRYLNPDDLLPYYMRLSPLLWYLFLLSVQVAFFVLVRQNGLHLENLRQNKSLYVASGLGFAFLLLVLIFVSVTKLGITKDDVYWGEPGIPIPGWLFVAVLLIGAGFLYYESHRSNSENRHRLNVIPPILIWLVAVILWLAVPLSSLKNSFYSPITPPYSTPFPYSDAGYYDYLAQSLLVGSDYLDGIPARPLYVTFLAVLHVLFGQNYVNMIAAQTMVLAVLPVALYWLGARIHSRAAGVVIAFFAIFRELASLWVSSETRTSVTKMFLTDLATTLFIVLVCLAVIRWLQRQDIRSTLFAGGLFGLLLLLRTQSLVILPILFLLAWFAKGAGRSRLKDWMRACLIFSVMLGLTILPWMLRNYVKTGNFVLDYLSPTSVIYSQMSGEIEQTDLGVGTTSGNQLLDLILRSPGILAGFIVNHFLNTYIGGLLALPLIARFDGLLAPINLYWMEWDGSLAWYNLLLIIFYLAIIALGLGAAWNRLKWIGLTPLAFSLGYALSNGITRFSAWRYNLPVDWVPYFYFGIGVIEIFLLAAQLFGGGTSKIFPGSFPEWKKDTLKPAHLFFASAFVLIGALPWIAEGIAPPRYTDQSSLALEQQVTSLSNAPAQAEIQAFLSQPDAFFQTGRLLYPRFFVRDKGIASSNPWPAYQVRDYSRFGFMLLNQNITSAVFPSRKDSISFPHAADVILLGCMREDYVDVRMIAFPDLNLIHTSAPLTEPCSP
jgi:hypothetical protein